MNDFAENKHFQFGKENPTLMEKPFWKYMVTNPQLSSYLVSIDLKDRRDCQLPIWCFARFGATQTYLRDGRLICIGGEHEDSYDPDFQIYNDVVVIQNPQLVEAHWGYTIPVPSNFPRAKLTKNKTDMPLMLGTNNVNDVTIYGYPLNVFPPTDFHSATYFQTKDKKEYIYIIGGTGCTCDGNHKPNSCNSGHHFDNTRVYRLSLSDFIIQNVKTSGSVPRGCTREHTANLLTVQGREIIEIETSLESVKTCFMMESSLKDRERARRLADGIGWGDHPKAYRLDIETGVWTISKQ